MKKGVAISAFYRIFGQSFESLKQPGFGNMRRINGKPTVDIWGHETRRRIRSSLMIKNVSSRKECLL